MNRREFLRNAAIIAGGVIAADQLELLERLAPRRLYFNGADFGSKDAFVAFYTDYWRLDFSDPRKRALLVGIQSGDAKARAAVIESIGELL